MASLVSRSDHGVGAAVSVRAACCWRSQLPVHADDKTLVALAADGTVTAADVPVILRHRPAWAGLVSALARHPGQVEAAIALLPRLPSHELEQVIRDWDPDRYTRTKGAAPSPPVP
ncbi:hypothetical protein ABTZ58_38285 [Streptomyces sp. NPDC094143]|uniref:hypothetical protein n=1 Tax=Streptomyces sp. NPDC094143 TaxID=3155310 RepID=UPI00332F2726